MTLFGTRFVRNRVGYRPTFGDYVLAHMRTNGQKSRQYAGELLLASYWRDFVCGLQKQLSVRPKYTMKFILGTKDGMTQVYDETGAAHPATVLRVSENVITQVKQADTDGYTAVQVATGAKKAANTKKAEKGHFGETGFHSVREFRTRFNFDDSVETFEKGATLAADVFAVGDTVQVSAISKGKGFQGVVKRHNFKGGPASHGQKHSHREPGSIGATGPARVFKGTN